jgi:hypothetical protein
MTSRRVSAAIVGVRRTAWGRKCEGEVRREGGGISLPKGRKRKPKGRKRKAEISSVAEKLR